ncbi:ribonuclease H-like domain-containing protein [Tanacetum coccineum]
MAGGHDFHENEKILQKDRSKGNQDSRRRDAWNTGNKEKDNGRRSGKQEDSKVLVTLDGEGVDWTSHSEDEHENYAFMACNSSGSDTEMSARDKAGLGYGDQLNKGVLSYENKVFQSVFVSRTSETENSPVNDRYAEGMHTVPPPMTGIYIPSGPNKEIDDSQFTYGPKQSKPSESDARSSDFTSCESNTSEETHESMPEKVINEPTVVSQHKVWNDAPIIEEYESDSEDEHVSLPSKDQETPIKTPRQTVKQQNTCSKSSKPDKKDCSGLISKKLGLGYGFTTKACFVCGSLSHLIRDCDFHEKRMAKQVKLNKQKGKGNVQRENKPVWNNVQRVNHKNQFVPTATCNAARKVNTVKPIVNNASPKADFYKTLSPFRKPFNRTTALRTNFSYQKVNTAEENTVSVVGGKRETAVKPSADYPQRALQNKGIVDSGCSRHMTGNKAYLAEYQDFNGGPVAFGGSKGYITGKGKIKTGKLDFEDVCFVKELQHFNLFSVSQMCDKKNKVLFTDTECLVLSPEFKLPDENQVLLRIPRQNNMYNFNLENIVPSGGLACLIAKATIDESNKWHRRLGHVNFKNLNKLVKGNLVRGLPLKIFQNDHTCVACQKGKQHKASCKAKSVSSISQPLQLLHMDLFGPTSVSKIHTDNNVADLLTTAFDVSSYLGSRVQLKRAIDGTKELLLPNFFNFWLTKVSTDRLIISTDKQSLYRYKAVGENTAKESPNRSLPTTLIFSSPTTINSLSMTALESCPKHNMIAYLEKTNGNTEFHEIMDFLTRSLIYYALTVIAGKPVTISEASIRSDLLFDDADGIDTLNNQAIFDTIRLIGHLDAKKKFVTYPRFISVFLVTQLKNVHVPLDHFPINALTKDEGKASERPSESKPIPSPPHPSEDQPELQPNPSPRPSPSIPIPDSNLEGSGRNHGGQSSSDRSLSGNEDGLTLQSIYDLYVSLCKHVTIQAKEIKVLKARIKKLKKKARPVITHHKAWMKSVSMKTRLAGNKSIQKKWMQKESVSKQGRKTAKSKPTAHKYQAFDDLDDFDAINFMETEDVHNEKGVSIEDQVSTVKPNEGIDKLKVSTDKIDEGTTELKNGNSDENATPTATLTIFGDDETITEFLIDPKDKGKKVLKEEAELDAESEGARIEADSILAARLQEEEREKFTIEERAKLLHDTITAQRRFLAQQRAAEIRSRPPTRTQLRNQMMTYLKHVGGKKHSDLKTKNFEEIQDLYEKVKRSDENFIAIGFAKDERLIKDVNKKATGTKKDDSIKKGSKEEETTDEDKEVDYEILDKKYPIIEWKTEYLGTKPQFDETKRLEEINLNVIPEGFDRVLWGDLMIMFNLSDEDEFWNSQQDWNVVSWKLHGSSGVHTLMTEARLVIHMLVEKKYPLKKKVLLKMLKLKLESEEDSTMALELIRFVKKLVAELEPENFNGDEEDI